VLRTLLALFVACLAVVVVATVYLPWWGFLLVLGGLFLVLMGAARLLTGRAAVLLSSVPFRAKGAVLKKAAAEVHAVEPVAGPAPGSGDGGGPRDRYTIDVTITPRPALGAFKLWEPGELLLVPAGARVRSLDDIPQGAGVSAVEVFHDGRFGPDEGLKYFGRQRIRLTVGVPRGWGRKAAFLYYLSKFGTVTLPPPARENAGAAGDRDAAGRRESTRP
jgi:hypothetical protein